MSNSTNMQARNRQTAATAPKRSLFTGTKRMSDGSDGPEPKRQREHAQVSLEVTYTELTPKPYQNSIHKQC